MILKGFFALFTYSSAGIKRQFIRHGEIDTFSSKVFRFCLSCSTASIYAAPLDAASSAIMPDPVKISRKERPVISPRQAKTDSRILSIAGLISRDPPGTEIFLPLRLPPVILILSFKWFQEDRLTRRCLRRARLSNYLREHRILLLIFFFLRCPPLILPLLLKNQGKLKKEKGRYCPKFH